MRKTWLWVAPLGLFAAGACASVAGDETGARGGASDDDASTDGGQAEGGASSGTEGTGAGNTGMGAQNPGGENPPAPDQACTGYDRRVVLQGSDWVEEICADGEGCVRGACVPAGCSDECYLGQTSGDDTCELYDLASDAWIGIDDDDHLHDRARRYEKWLRKDTESLFHDGVVSVRYQSSALDDVDDVYFGDTALHTGLYMAAEAYRLTATGAWRARKNLRAMVDIFHLWFNVSGDPAVLANIAAPAGDSKLRQYSDWNCSDHDRFCNVSYDGQQWDYVGEPSRDMYMGPLLGLPATYAALGEYDESYRETIRQDLMTLAQELVKKRSLPVRFVINGTEMPVTNMEARFFIPEPPHMVDGAVEVHFSFSDLDGGSILGGQEFMPNPSTFLRQHPLLSSVPDVPRASSAMMVPAIIGAAVYVTEGVDAYQSQRDELISFYYDNADQWGNVDTWIDGAAQWTDTHDCGDRYFGRNLAWIAAYSFALLENDDATLARITGEVLDPKLWADAENHKNSFFNFMYAATSPNAPQSAADVAVEQVEDFPNAPRKRRDVDETNNNKYASKESGCSNEVNHDTAVDTGDRPVVYFQWHSNPWLLRDSGDAKQTYPGHDYLVAYWMGRAFGHIDDDTSGACLRWR